jgi:hypothetical protein
MSKNAFLDLVAGRFLAAHPAWRQVHVHRRHYQLSVGRAIGDACFVWLAFACRPDRHRFGHSVGWHRSEAAYLDRLGLRENQPVFPTDGSLRRLHTLESPRDFQCEEMYRATASLHTPLQVYDLEASGPEALCALMLGEIRDYALPYLAMMLAARHGLPCTPEQLASDAIPLSSGAP